MHATNRSQDEADLREQDRCDTDSDYGEPDVRVLARQVRDLQQRVHSLEQRFDNRKERLVQVPSEPKPTSAQPAKKNEAKTVPTIGEAFLAVGGAYLLRALAESKLIPITVAVGAGILYAFIWLILAARVTSQRPVVAAIRTLTSALILLPLLWEVTTQFGALSTGAAAGVIVVFSCLGLAVSWRSNLPIITWITTAASLLMVIVLLTATHDVVPFTLALLVMAAVGEGTACFGRCLSQRWIIAIVTDFSILFIASIAASEHGVPEGYAHFSTAIALVLQIALLAIYLSSTSVRAFRYTARLSAFDVTQIVISLLLSMSGVVRITHGDPFVLELVSAFAFVCGGLFYLAAFWFGRRTTTWNKNFYTYSTLGLTLVSVGTLIQLSGVARVLSLTFLAVASLVIAWWKDQAAFRWHGVAYLSLATIVSDLAQWGGTNLLGRRPGWVPFPPAAAITIAVAVLSYLLIWRTTRAGHASALQAAPPLALAAIAFWGMGAMATAALIRLLGGSFPGPLRTFVLTALALLLGLGGVAWKRRELVWLVYPFMALTAYRLLVQDLPEGQTLSLFASLSMFGAALIFLPRVLQTRGTLQQPLAGNVERPQSQGDSLCDT